MRVQRRNEKSFPLTIRLFSPWYTNAILVLLLLSSICHQNAASLSSSNTSKRNLVSGGLINLGNTCYLNAQLECAYHIPKIRSIILNQSHDDPSIALLSLQQLFTQMEKASLQGSNDPKLTPAASTSLLCRNIGINPYEQQDSQEFWKLFLPELDSQDLTNLFKGSYETYIAALDDSGREKIRKEIFLDLSLDVSNFDNAHSSMEDMFTSGELLLCKEGNGWRPEKGAEKVDAIKGNKWIVKGDKNDDLVMPKILQLHLMRFNYDWQSGIMSKINSRFSFLKTLDLKGICDSENEVSKEDFLYDLQSVVVHVGEYGSGHYYAYVRPDIQSKKWFRYDDDRVTEVTFQDVQDDAFGGRAIKRTSQEEKRSIKGNRGRNRFLKRFFSRNNRNQFGFGGRTSCAYMLQYVKRTEVPFLYEH